jgi:hypothetical protein
VNLASFRRIDTPEELEQVEVFTIVVEQPDRWGETYVYQRVHWEIGFGTHDWELGWANSGDDDHIPTSDIGLPAFVIYEPAWGRDSALTSDVLQPIRIDQDAEQTAARREQAERIVKEANNGE